MQTGLGLSICRSIVRNHGGDVLVTSQLGSGTVFDLFLPVSSGKIEETAAVATPKNAKPAYGQGKILVMDDEERIRNITGEILTRLGYEAIFSRDGDEAVHIYKESLGTGDPFDAVILDLTVRGGMGGRETIELLLNLDPNVKAIVTSGYLGHPVMSDFKKFGFKGVLPKPYNIIEFGKTIKEILDSPERKNRAG